MRPRSVYPVLVLLTLFLSAPARAHNGAEPRQQPPAPAFRLEKLSERAWCLFGQGGNVGFLVTDDGVIVVDAQYDRVAEGVVAQIRTVTDRPIRYLVSTHYHDDHTGGNKVFARQAEIIAHDRVRPRMLEYPKVILRDFPPRLQEIQAEIGALPEGDAWRITLERDAGLMKFFLDSVAAFDPALVAAPKLTYDGQMKVFMGGQEVWIIHVAPGHTDGDSIVYFRNENVLHMGDLFFNGMYPFIDMMGGGSVRGYLESVDYAISHVPPDAKVIPGHGPVTDIAGLKRMRSFLADLMAEVEKASKVGMSRADSVRAIRMEAYPEIKPSFRVLGNVVAAAWDEIRGGR